MMCSVSDPASSNRRPLRSDSVQTQAKLINVAEKLFAERGIDAVSLSEINRGAEQGNNSALHYHFGSKDGLLEAIREKHRRQIRSAAKDSFASLPADPSAHDVVTALVQPIALRLDDPDGGGYYLRICTQSMTNPSHTGFGFGDEATPEEFQPFGTLIWELAPDVPPPLRSQRVSLMTATLFIGLASIAEDEEALAALSEQRVLRVNNLIDSITGLLTAPASRSRRSWAGDPEALGSPVLIELDDHAGGRTDGDRVIR
jgi:AcrR family transcriptional regulator